MTPKEFLWNTQGDGNWENVCKSVEGAKGTMRRATIKHDKTLNYLEISVRDLWHMLATVPGCPAFIYIDMPTCLHKSGHWEDMVGRRIISPPFPTINEGFEPQLSAPSVSKVRSKSASKSELHKPIPEVFPDNCRPPHCSHHLYSPVEHPFSIELFP